MAVEPVEGNGAGESDAPPVVHGPPATRAPHPEPGRTATVSQTVPDQPTQRAARRHMTTLADLVAVTTSPQDASRVLTVRVDGYKLLGAAALYDLLDRGRLGRTGEGRGSRVVLLDPSPVTEPSLEYGLARVRDHAEQRPRNAVLRLASGTKAVEGVYGGLVDEGILGPGEKRGRFSSRRYPLRDTPRRDDLLDGLARTLLDGAPPDEPVRRLAALLAVGHDDAGRVLDPVLDGAGVPASGSARRGAARRASATGMELVKADWVALTALASIQVPKRLSRTAVTLGIAEALIPD